ncbi:hypothetical protein VNO78_15942 [Psophocarpus tetragonolobus]|uniref:Dicer-like 3 n=1 Tax=Psophocarpus tetragonolobus TaxID=3891 RepID=A0AAN9SFF9_PSOTE
MFTPQPGDVRNQISPEGFGGSGCSFKMSQCSSNATNFDPRSYQTEVFQVAKLRNTIAVLDTGAGKTLIAVMLIKHISQNIKSTDENKLIIFLAPTVHLVNQQFEVIRDNTDLAVGEYYGTKGIDGWNSSCWEKEVEEHDVMVMTPQILLDSLRKAFFKMETVSLLVIDECHRASGSHPYVKIMKEFYHTSANKPKIFGMTASPVIGKAIASYYIILKCYMDFQPFPSVVSSTADCKVQISRLEIVLDSQIFAIKDRIELERCVPIARENCRFYDQAQFLNNDLKVMMEDLWSQFDTSLLRLQQSVECQYKDIDDTLGKLRKRLFNGYSKVLYCLDDLGLVCAYEAVKFCLENSPFAHQECEFSREGCFQYASFFNELMKLIGAYFNTDDTDFEDFGDDLSKEVELGYLSPKLNELIKIFKSFGIITAKVIDKFVKKVKFLSHFTVSYLTGSNTSSGSLAPKEQREILQLFSNGKLELVNFGGNLKQRNQLFDIIRSEYSMKNTAKRRELEAFNLETYRTPKTCAYYVDATGACVTTDSSVSLVHRYCEKLPSDKYFIPKPVFQFSNSGGQYECKLILPPTSPFQIIIGPPSTNSHLSRQLVCLEACKKLHELGALNDHLLPFSEEPPESNISSSWKNSPSGEGTTKRKELHGTVSIHALSGGWASSQNGATFHAYKFDFSSNTEEIYSGFVLLTGSKLDNDVGNIEKDLYLISKTVTSHVSSGGELYLNSEQMMQAKCFHELFFNGLFGKLFVGSEEAGTKREFLLQNQITELWNPLKMYLLLPLETLNSSSVACRINWRGVSSCVSVINFLKRKFSLSSENCPKQKLSNWSDSSDAERKTSSKVHFANCFLDVNDIKDVVVLAIHTGRFYSIVEIVKDSSAECPFSYDGEDVDSSSDYSSYIEYFNRKYGIVLKYPGQPLLRLKQSHNPHNLLVKFNGNASVLKNSQVHAYMPPEILEALTTLKCCESFSMERLELLGDSILKYAVSSHLFLRYPEKHEGQLSDWRSTLTSNSSLHRFGIECKLQGYIYDSAFEPRRWVAPGQYCIHPVPCGCGVDTFEVPLDKKFQTDNPKVKIGKFCDKGHRWMCSKTIPDCVEALIGAYYIGGGLTAALHVMQWLGTNVGHDSLFVHEAITRASLRSYFPKANNIQALELKLGYEFSTKGLLLEAMTHPSQQELEPGICYCYQRLEFLGDSVLGFLVTRHIYESYPNIDPGLLTSLRSEAVSNENFAQCCVRRNLHPHLQHCSGILQSQVTKFISSMTETTNSSKLRGKAPKALGDMVESIAGAMLIDTKLDIEKVWRIFEPLLSPIVTPENLELPALCKLHKLCDCLGYFIKELSTKEGELHHVELQLQLEDFLLVGRGTDRNKKRAKGAAAHYLLEGLENKGILYSKCISKRRKHEFNDVGISSSVDMRVDTLRNRMQKNGSDCTAESTDSFPVNDCSKKTYCISSTPPVIESIDIKKGGPRTSIYSICKKLQWPLPKFICKETKSSTPIEFGEGSGKRIGFNSFISNIILQIPNSGIIECTGDPKADKKSSFDSAATALLYELEQQQKIVIVKP